MDVALVMGEIGMHITGNPGWIPQAQYCSVWREITLQEAIAGTPVHPATVRALLRTGKIKGRKINGRWYVRTYAIANWLIKYRYRGRRNGKWWTTQETEAALTMPPKQAAAIIGRSYRAIIIRRHRWTRVGARRS